MKKLFIILSVISILIGIKYFIPEKPLTLEDCVEFGICKEGLEFYYNNIKIVMSKEYCLKENLKWDEQSSSCNIRKTTY